MPLLEKILSKTNYQKLSLFLYLFGCCLVFYFIFFDHPMGNYLYSDMKSYWSRSLNLLNGNKDPMNLFHPTGMIYMGAIDENFFYHKKFYFTRAVFFLMAISIPLMSGFSFQRIFQKKILMPIAALIIFHYQFISFTGFFLAEIPSSFFITLLLLVGSLFRNSITIPRAFIIGGIFVLSFAFKGNIAFFLPSFLLLLFFFNYKNSKKRLTLSFLKPAVSLIAAFFFFILILAGLNKHFLGRFQALGTVGGVNFYMAKCPIKNLIDSGRRKLGSPVHYQLDYKKEISFNKPFTDSYFFYKKSLECLLKDPKRIFNVFPELSHMFDGSYVWPPVMTKKYSQLVRWLQNFYALLIFPGILIFFVILFRDKKYENIVLTSLVLGSLILPFVFIGDVRYRSVFDPLFIPGALLGWIAIGKSELFKVKEERVITFSLLVYMIFCVLPISYCIMFLKNI